MSSTNNDSKKKKVKTELQVKMTAWLQGVESLHSFHFSPWLSTYSNLARVCSDLTFLIGSEFKVHIPKLVLPGQLNLDVKNDIYSDF